MAKRMNLNTAMHKAYENAQNVINPGETLLSYSMVASQTGAFVTQMVLAGIFIGFGIITFFANRIEGSLAGGFIGLVILAGLGLLVLISGLAQRRTSKYKYCFVTDARLGFSGEKGEVWDIKKEEIKKAGFLPKGIVLGTRSSTRLRHDQIHLMTSKKYNFALAFHGKETFAAIMHISEPFWIVK